MLHCAWAFFLQRFLRFFSESAGKDICVGRLFTRSMYLPFSLMGLFSLHLLRLCKETFVSYSPAAPGRSDLSAAAALRRLPKTRAPLCGYSGGLHAPNVGRKNSLEEPVFSLSKKSGLALARSSPQAAVHPSDAGRFDVPAGPACSPHCPNGQPRLAEMLPQAGAWPRSLSWCQMKVFSLLLPALCFGDKSSVNLLSVHFQGQVSISVIIVITMQVTARTRWDELFSLLFSLF